MIPAFPPARAQYEKDLSNVRAQLDAETLDAAWTEGRAMTPGEAVVEALGQPG